MAQAALSTSTTGTEPPTWVSVASWTGFPPDRQRWDHQRCVGSQPREAPAQRPRRAAERRTGREDDGGPHQSFGDVRGLEKKTFPVCLRPGVPRPHSGHGQCRDGQGEGPRAPVELPVGVTGVGWRGVILWVGLVIGLGHAWSFPCLIGRE